MSTFEVLVIGDSPAQQLAPFESNNEGYCAREHLVFEETETARRAEYDTGTSERIVMSDGQLLAPFDKLFRVQGTAGHGAGTHSAPTELERRMVPFKELFTSFEQFMEDWYGIDERDPETKVFGEWVNPNARFDAWRPGVGPRGAFKLKPGAVGLLHWPATASVPAPPPGYADACRIEGLTVEGLQAAARVLVVVKDGQWFQPGDIGWWGDEAPLHDNIQWEARISELLATLAPHTAISMVTCRS